MKSAKAEEEVVKKFDAPRSLSGQLILAKYTLLAKFNDNVSN